MFIPKPFYVSISRHLTHAPLTAYIKIQKRHYYTPPRANNPSFSASNKCHVSTRVTDSLSLLSLTSLRGGATIAAAARRRRHVPLLFPAEHPRKRQHATHRRPKRGGRVATRLQLVLKILVPRRHLNCHTNQRRLRLTQSNRRGRRRRTGSVLIFAWTGFGNRIGYRYNNHFRFRRAFNRGATKRTRVMRMEPHVNTFYVETVITFGQDPTRFTGFELRQANSALRPGFFRVEGEDGECGKDGGVEATWHGCGGGVVVVKDKLGAAELALAPELAAASTPEVPARVDMKAQHQNDDEEKKDYCWKHDFSAEAVTLCIELFRVWIAVFEFV